MELSKTPHDAFVRQGLSNVEVAKDLLKAHLQLGITQKIDWQTLKLTNKSFVSKDLAQLHSDVVFSCKIKGKEAYIYTLIEHQSTPDVLLPFRILKYDVALMEQHLKQGHAKLPIIANLCLYAGKKSPYPYSTDIYDCFEVPELARSTMFKLLQLIDLTTISEKEIITHGQADLLELLLKQSQQRSFFKWIKDNPALLQKLLERIYGFSAIVYILATEQRHAAKEIIDTLIDLKPNKKEEIMTAAQQLRQEGMQQGMQQGIQTVARNMLHQLHLGIEVVQQATGLSKAEIARLTK
ncbi:MAG: Rpn family recombination-promoting nuclease/putative transposase [Bacteroidota bacterium]